MSQYTYPAELVRVIDGDTIVVNLDLGFGISKQKEVLRLAGIDAPEKRGETVEAGRSAENYLYNLLFVGGSKRPLQIETIKTTKGTDTQGKYGRYIAIVWLDGPSPVNVNDAMIAAGHAVIWSK